MKLKNTVPSLGHGLKSGSMSCQMLNIVMKLSRLPGFSYFPTQD